MHHIDTLTEGLCSEDKLQIMYNTINVLADLVGQKKCDDGWKEKCGYLNNGKSCRDCVIESTVCYVKGQIRRDSKCQNQK